MPMNINLTVVTAFAPYAALAVTILVWALTQRSNRKHEVFKERVKRRVEMFDGLLPLMVQLSEVLQRLNIHPEDQDAIAQANVTCKLLGDYRVKMLCYATDEERNAYEEVVDAINKKDQATFPKRHNKLVDLARKNLRNELGIK
jgi:hypothetical protein